MLRRFRYLLSLRFFSVILVFFLLCLLLPSLFPSLFSKQVDNYDEWYGAEDGKNYDLSNYILPLILSRILGAPFNISCYIVHVFFFIFSTSAISSFKYFFQEKAPFTVAKKSLPRLVIFFFFTPAFLYFSFTTLREFDIACVFLAGILSVFNLRYFPNLFDLMLSALSIIFLFVLRAEYLPFYILILILLYFTPPAKFRSHSSLLMSIFTHKFWIISRTNFFLITAFFLSFLVVLFLNFDLVLTKFGVTSSLDSLSTLQSFTSSRLARNYDSGSNFNCGYFNYACSLLAWPLAPIPLNPFSQPLFLLVLIDSLFISYKIKCTFFSANYPNRINPSFITLAYIPLIAMVLVLNLFMYNLGNLFRLRSALMPLLFGLYAIISVHYQIHFMPSKSAIVTPSTSN